MNRIGRKLNALAFDLLQAKAAEEVLEIGYGGGGLLRRLANEGLQRLSGVDVSSAVPREISGAELRTAHASSLPFADGSFDAVVSVSVLHFWNELEPVFAEIGRVLRHGGRLVLVFEPPEVLKRWTGSRYGFQMWTEEDVTHAAVKAGLSLDSRADGYGRRPDYYVGLRFRKGAA